MSASVSGFSFSVRPSKDALFPPGFFASLAPLSAASLSEPAAAPSAFCPRSTYKNREQWQGHSPFPTDFSPKLSDPGPDPHTQQHLFRELLKNFLFHDGDASAPLLSSVSRYQEAATMPNIGGFIVVLRFRRIAPPTKPFPTATVGFAYDDSGEALPSVAQSPASALSTSHILLVLGPSAFPFAGQPAIITDYPIPSGMTAFGHTEHRLPKTILAPVMTSVIANSRLPKVTENPFRMLSKHADSILITLCGHVALFKNLVIIAPAAHSTYQVDDWNEFFMDLSEKEQFKTRYAKARESGEALPRMTVSSDDTTTQPQHGWCFTAALPLPPNHGLPISLALDADKVPMVEAFINNIAGWLDRGVKEIDKLHNLTLLASRLQWLENPYIDNWFRAVTLKPEYFAEEWLTLQQAQPSLSVLTDVAPTNTDDASAHALPHKTFLHQSWSLASKLYYDNLWHKASDTMKQKFQLWAAGALNYCSDDAHPMATAHEIDIRPYLPILVPPQSILDKTKSWSEAYGFKHFSDFNVPCFIQDIPSKESLADTKNQAPPEPPTQEADDSDLESNISQDSNLPESVPPSVDIDDTEIFGSATATPGMDSPIIKVPNIAVAKRIRPTPQPKPINLFGVTPSSQPNKRLKTSICTASTTSDDEPQFIKSVLSPSSTKPPIVSEKYHDPVACNDGYNSDLSDHQQRSPWYFNDEAVNVFTSNKIQKLSKIKPTDYIPKRDSLQTYPDGIFTYKRFVENDAKGLNSIHLRWSFLGIFGIPTTLSLFDPRSLSHPKHPYSPDYHFAPSILSPAWLNDVFPYITTPSSKQGYLASDAANALLQAAIKECNDYQETPFTPNFNIKWLQDDTVRKAIETMNVRSGLLLNRTDSNCLAEAITPFTFLSSVPNLGNRLPANGLTLDNLSDILGNFIFFTSLILGNVDFYSSFPPGFSPYLLRGIFPGNILWLRNKLGDHLLKQAWSRLQIQNPERAKKLSGALLIHVGILMDTLLTWMHAPSHSKLCHPATPNAVGDTQTRCALLLDRKAINHKSLSPELRDWRNVAERIWSVTGINATPSTHHQLTCVAEQVPQYLFASTTPARAGLPTDTSTNKSDGRKQAPSTAQPNDGSKSQTDDKPLSKNQLPKQPAQKATISLIKLTDWAKNERPSFTTGKTLFSLKRVEGVKLPQGQTTPHCFNFFDQDNPKGCEGEYSKATKSWKPCTRLHFDLGVDSKPETEQKQLLQPLWNFLQQPYVAQCIVPTDQFTTLMS